MMGSALLGPRTRRQEIWTGPVIDADVHAVVPGLDTLFPHMEPQWVDFARERWLPGPDINNVYPPNAPSTVRSEWRTESGGDPATELAHLQRHILDPWDVDHAILNCYYGIEWVRHPDFAPALARAVNNWLIAEWLDKDPRLRASLVVPPRDPAEMVKEIERVGDHPGFVQVLMPVRSERLYGQRVWHPVYAAMERAGLVFGLHWGGGSEAGAPTPTGWPSWFVEEYAGEQQVYMAQLMSLVAEGVFAAFPDLKVAVGEIGFAWVPSLWWRMETKRKGLRRDIPWVNQPIHELFRERVRFTVAPIDAGPPQELAKIIEWLGSDDILMFATDYPHMHDDDLTVLLDVLGEDARRKLMSENARDLYGL
jgi:predicted TIM-barrel fold metal-dependent hydrolase